MAVEMGILREILSGQPVTFAARCGLDERVIAGPLTTPVMSCGHTWLEWIEAFERKVQPQERQLHGKARKLPSDRVSIEGEASACHRCPPLIFRPA